MSVAGEELRVRESSSPEVQHAVGYLGKELRRGEAGQDRHGEMTSDNKQGLGRAPEKPAAKAEKAQQRRVDPEGHRTRMAKKAFPCRVTGVSRGL